MECWHWKSPEHPDKHESGDSDFMLCCWRTVRKDSTVSIDGDVYSFPELAGHEGERVHINFAAGVACRERKITFASELNYS